MLSAIRLIVLIFSVGPLVYYLLCFYCVVDYFRAQGKTPLRRDFAPPISILKPVRGVDREAYQNFASYCQLDYPEYELVFAVAELTPDLPQRLAQLDVHPTGPMWGAGELMSRGPALQLEQRIGLDLAPACQCVIDAGLRQERRSLRLKVRDLQWESQPNGVVLRFWLRSGSFATAVLRELLKEQSAGGQSLVVDADDV